MAAIARNFPRHEVIQGERAIAWKIAVTTAVKFDDEILINQALGAIDAMVGVTRDGASLTDRSAYPLFPSVVKERADAFRVYEAWRHGRRDGAPQ